MRGFPLPTACSRVSAPGGVVCLSTLSSRGLCGWALDPRCL
nr:MAG TPA: hypothetical protein [Caudoviricetes sp.]